MSQNTSINELDINKIILNAKNGDENAYSHLIDILKPALISISKKYYLPKYDYEDIYQVSLIGLYQGVLSFKLEHSKNPLLFLKLCIKREVYDLIKSLNRQKCYSINNSISIETPIINRNNTAYTLSDTLSTDYNFLDNIILEKESREIIKEKINKLTKIERDIFALYLNDFTPQEISRFLNINTKQIDNALQRAKRKMRVLMNSN